MASDTTERVSGIPSPMPLTQFGKRKFLDTLDDLDSHEEIDPKVARRLLSLTNWGQCAPTVLSRYKQRHARANKDKKKELEHAFQIYAEWRGMKLLLQNAPCRSRAKDCPKKLKQIAMDNFCSNLYAHFLAGNLCDFTICCEGFSWEVHRLVLCSNSEYFDTCLSNKSFKENEESKIVLKDDEPILVDELVSFLYTCDYELPECESNAIALIFHVDMYILGDKYGVYALKCVARQKLGSVLEDMNFTKLDIKYFLTALIEIYGTVLAEEDDQLRELFCVILRKHQLALKKDEEFMALIRRGLGNGAFDRDVVKALIHG